MDEFSFEKGVFIHSKDLESQFLLQCLCSLLKSCTSIRIHSLECDEKTNGFKVYFGESESKIVLTNKYLEISNQRLLVFPLSTYLLIHDVHKGNSDVERNLTEAIESKFGKVLNIDQLPQLDDKHTISYLVLLDVPENEYSTIFEKNGYPSMRITVSKMYKTYKVTFWCRSCKNSGHSLQQCTNKENKVEVKEKSPISSGITGKSDIKIQPMPGGSTTNASASSILEPIDSFATKIGEEVVKNHGISTELRYKITEKGKRVSNKLVKDYSIKVGHCVEECTNISISGISSENANNLSVKKEIEHREEIGLQNNDATSTTTDDDVQVLDFSERSQELPPTQVPVEAATTTKTNIKIKEEPNFLFSDQNDLQNYPVTPKIEQPLLLQQQSSTSTSAYQSSHHQVTSVLSPQLQSCLDSAYKDYTVLDRQKLDAFLVHVKKKSNPIRVAKNYTENVNGLKDQLNRILHYYYNTLQVGTKEDIQFIKWLCGLVERFDGSIPRKRKRRSSVSEDSVAKKESCRNEDID